MYIYTCTSVQCLDFEVELAFVIGKEGKNIKVGCFLSRTKVIYMYL